MESANPLNPTYMDLWKELFEVVIKPVLKENLSTSNPTRGLPSRLREYCYDEHFYPFIYDRIIHALEVYCEETILPKLLNLRGTNLIMEACYFCMQDVHFKTMKLWYPILALERTYAYLMTRNLKRQFPPLELRAGDIFNRAVYQSIADLLREAAFECITDAFTIRSEYTLNNYLELLHFIRTTNRKFFDKEWSIFAHTKIIEIVCDSFMFRSKPFPEFLKIAENLFISSRTIFLLSKEEYEVSIELMLFGIRDDRIFGNDAKVFKTMLEETDAKTLKKTFNTFQHDKEFPKTMALQSLKVFSEMVQGKGQNLNEDRLNQESIFRQLFVLWLRLLQVHKNEDVNEKTIYEALIIPFLTVINSTFPDSKAIIGVLAQYSENLLFRIHQGQTKSEPEGIREVRAILSLVSYLPTADGFQTLFRALASKTLLKGTSEPVRINQIPTIRSSRNQVDVVSDIFAMLDDASTWPSYEMEMLPTVTKFGLKHGKLELEPRVVRRSRWDLDTDIGLVFPRKLRLLSRAVLKHLHLWHPMRCASIHSSMGEMNITSNVWTFRENYVRVKLSAAQSSVLILFEEEDELTLGDVAKSILSTSGKLSGFNALVAIVKSMMKEHEMLLKQPQNSRFLQTDMISLNRHFQPKSEHITLPSPEYSDENREVLQAAVTTALTRYHKMAMEASVMKVLKQEREMELHRLKERVYSKPIPKENVGMDSFEEVIERLARDEYLTVDNTIARYME